MEREPIFNVISALFNDKYIPFIFNYYLDDGFVTHDSLDPNSEKTYSISTTTSCRDNSLGYEGQ